MKVLTDRDVHFGLGVDRAAKLIEIQWPSGVRQKLENPAIDKRLTVEEP